MRLAKRPVYTALTMTNPGVTLQKIVDSQKLLLSAVYDLSERVTSLENAVSSMELKADNMVEDLDHLTHYTLSGFETVNTRFDYLEDRFDRMESAIDRL